MPGARKRTVTRVRLWVLRGILLLGLAYATFASAFYGWYGSFPGANQTPAIIVANIWSIVALACIAALLLSFVSTHRGAVPFTRTKTDRRAAERADGADGASRRPRW